MGINKLVFASLVVGCLAAAAGGGYLAMRQNTWEAAQAAAPETAAVASQAVPAAAARDDVAPAPVEPASPSASAAPAVAEIGAPERVASSSTAASSSSRAAGTRITASRTPASGAPVPGSSSRTAAVSGPSADVPVAPASLEPAEPTLAPPADAALWETRASVTPEPAQGQASVAPAEFIDLIVPAGAVVGLRFDRTISSESAQVEETVSAHVTEDVLIGGQVAIPAGAVATGTVMEVARPRRLGGRTRLTVRFHTVLMPDGSRVTLRTDAIMREGSSGGAANAAKVGGAAMGGTILGAILGGRKGAIIGGTIGAGGGAAAVMAGEREAVTIPGGAVVHVRVQQPVAVTVARDHDR